ncbi:transcriptional regulator PtsJ [Mycobacterium sp. GA-1841]|uniref:aminotransferase class I/II-fold pyridoxal phosphate-dependent enzyme n=1 Tax=Mycobacterium sp. GA-1841 TaxID=1834154 RepID=UPI00096C726B|nr:aminotransferase class I/II-fold pyridoxal phosphate-dependent enzyme [Mycobacterium sp. GA-1841]OMC32570.1 transcriptional regulator PtsJ [Mycobacterium sp. GA-1841]
MSGISGSTANAIAESIRDLVLRGDFEPGFVLPPIRALAADLEVNRNTVAAAYRQLVAAGVAEGQGRLGTAIARIPEVDTEHQLEPSLADLASGNPDPDLLPDLRNALAHMSYQPPLYGSSPITADLSAVAATLFDGDVPAAEIVVTHGAVDAVERVLNSCLTRGDTVAIEDPCFLASIGTVRLNGYRRAPVPLDDHGMTPEGLRAALVDRRARAVILTPRAHNPTGASLSGSRAAELRAVLAEYPEVLVIEDDYLSIVSSAKYHRVTPETTKHWALIRSFGKSLGPDLRLAVVATDVQTAHILGARLRAGKDWVSHLLQAVVARLMSDAEVIEGAKHARDVYAKRSAMLVKSLAEKGISVFGNPDGLNVWIDLPDANSVSTVVARLAQAGWAVQSSQLFAVDPYRPRHGIRVTSATIDRRTAEKFATELAEILDSLGVPR